jgi:RNA polymerase-binding transcription factor DksA
MSFSYEKAKQQLLEEKAKLVEQLEQLDASKYESIGYSNHIADDATDAFDQAVDETLKHNAETSLEEVEQALAKFDDGTYGLCEVCGARIDRARLEALPYARHCLECQERREHSRKGAH